MRLPINWENLINQVLELQEFYKKLDLLIKQSNTVIPQSKKIFNVFEYIDPGHVTCVLYGEDPYPRVTSANGVAFWDMEIKSWSDKTNGNSLKNMLKGLLVARGWADYQTPIEQCREIAFNKQLMSPSQIFEYWLRQGVLLVNTALTFDGIEHKKKHLSFWQPFHRALIEVLHYQKPYPYFILWGKKAIKFEAEIRKYDTDDQRIIRNGHPTFIHQFLDKNNPGFSPFIEIEQKTGFKWI